MHCSQIDRNECVDQAAEMLRAFAAVNHVREPLDTAVILGSGLHAAAANALQHGAVALAYGQVSGMPVPRVEGHAGRFVIGGSDLNGVILLQGRSHIYEGWSMVDVAYPVEVLSELGVRHLIITNAAGGIHDDMHPGDLMLVREHLSLLDFSDLVSSAWSPSVGRRASPVWSERLIDAASKVDTSLRIGCGCYAMMSGPNYESPAEVRMLRIFGADAVGMSTVPEAITGHRLGMDVLGVSCITNAAAGLSDKPLSHKEVGETAAAVETEFCGWLNRLLRSLRDS